MISYTGMYFENYRICLRWITENDTSLIIGWRNDPKVRCNFVYREIFTTEIHEKWLRESIKTGKAVQMIICKKSDGRPIGSVYFRDINYKEHTAEFGIFIGEAEARGKGYGYEAVKMALQTAKEKLNLHIVILRVFTDNVKAIRCYERSGFVKEGNNFDVICSDGEKKKMVMMMILL